MRILILMLTVLVVSSTTYAVSYFPGRLIASENAPTLEKLKLEDVNGASKPLSIPKSWKLVSVSENSKNISCNLWFQDTDGSVYLLQEFTFRKKINIRPYVYKIPAK
jgi:hypothetical protein